MNVKTGYMPMWCEVFTSDEVKKIIKICEKYETTKGETFNKNDTDSARKSNVRWIPTNEETEWMYHRVRDMVLDVNQSDYKFDIKGMENFQFTEYSEEYTGFYDFHQDTMIYDDLSGVRKLSVTILLSDPSEFDGGEFLYQVSNHVMIPKVSPGKALIFPSWILHKVNPVYRGKRKSLVCWVYGDLFK